MTGLPNAADQELALLDPEWARIELLVAMAEALRTGTPLEEDYSNLFADVDRRVAEGREAGKSEAKRS